MWKSEKVLLIIFNPTFSLFPIFTFSHYFFSNKKIVFDQLIGSVIGNLCLPTILKYCCEIFLTFLIGWVLKLYKISRTEPTNDGLTGIKTRRAPVFKIRDISRKPSSSGTYSNTPQLKTRSKVSSANGSFKTFPWTASMLLSSVFLSFSNCSRETFRELKDKSSAMVLRGRKPALWKPSVTIPVPLPASKTSEFSSIFRSSDLRYFSTDWRYPLIFNARLWTSAMRS